MQSRKEQFIRYKNLEKTLQAIRTVLQSDEIDPVTRKQGEERAFALEQELSALRSQRLSQGRSV
jgi:hypothetical protein